MVFPLRKKETEGFTLIELLVVISIISLLSSIVLASLGTAREKARYASAQSGMQSLSTELFLIGSQNPSGYIEGNDGACDAILADNIFGSITAGSADTAVRIIERIGSDLQLDLSNSTTDCAADFGNNDETGIFVFDLRNLSSGEYGCVKQGKWEIISESSFNDAYGACYNI